MAEISWTDGELTALAMYRHAETHEDAREAEEDLRAHIAAREAQAAAKALREPVRAHPDAAVLRAAAAVVEVCAKTRPHLMSLVNRLLTLAADLTPARPDQEEDR